MADKLTDKQVTKLKNAFVLFSDNEEEDGNVRTEQLGFVVRAVGKNPTEAEIKEMKKKLNDDSGETFGFDTFKDLMADKINDENDSIEKIGEAFQTLDQHEKGYIPAAELKQILTTQGEKLTEEEVTKLIVDADTNKDNKISYDEFMNLMKSK